MQNSSASFHSAYLTNEECTWVIDFSASFHITLSRECFSTYIAKDHGYVRMGDNKECKIVRIGRVTLTMSTGFRLSLREVRDVLDMRLNLISTERLDDEGYRGSF